VAAAVAQLLGLLMAQLKRNMVENEEPVYRVGELADVPAAVRFLSVEPLLATTAPVWARSKRSSSRLAAPD
jgi:protein gp37